MYIIINIHIFFNPETIQSSCVCASVQRYLFVNHCWLCNLYAKWLHMKLRSGSSRARDRVTRTMKRAKKGFYKQCERNWAYQQGKRASAKCRVGTLQQRGAPAATAEQASWAQQAQSMQSTQNTQNTRQRRVLPFLWRNHLSFFNKKIFFFRRRFVKFFLILPLLQFFSLLIFSSLQVFFFSFSFSSSPSPPFGSAI